MIMIKHSFQTKLIKTLFINETTRQISIKTVTNGDKISLDAEKEHFYGKQKVTPEEKGKLIFALYENVSKKYNTCNRIIMLGFEHKLRNKFIAHLNPNSGGKLIDVCCGTGDMTLRYLEALKESTNVLGKSSVVAVDLNPHMLEVLKDRSRKLGFESSDSFQVQQGTAEELPFPSNHFDKYSISLGLRNVTNVDRTLQEAFRVLKPGGRFYSIEASLPPNRLIKFIYDIYSYTVMRLVGRTVYGGFAQLEFLIQSVRKFPKQEELKVIIENAGFSDVKYENIAYGIFAIHSGIKK